MNFHRILITTVLLAAYAASSAFAANRLALGNQPSKLYKELCDSFDRKDSTKAYDALQKSLCSICDDVKSIHAIDIKSEMTSAIDASNFTEAKNSLLKLVFFDTRAVYTEINSKLPQATETTTLHNWLLVAYSNYVILSPMIQEKNMVTDLRLRKMFNAVLSRLSTSGYTEKTTVLDNDTRTLVKDFLEKSALLLAEALPQYQ